MQIGGGRSRSSPDVQKRDPTAFALRKKIRERTVQISHDHSQKADAQAALDRREIFGRLILWIPENSPEVNNINRADANIRWSACPPFLSRLRPAAHLQPSKYRDQTASP